MSIENIHREIQLARPILTPFERKDGYSYQIGSKRAIRISPCAQAGSLFLVKAASERAKLPNARGLFSGTFAELLAIVDREIALIQAEMLKRASTGARHVQSNSPKSTALRAPARDGIKDFVFERVVNGLTGMNGLIYRWEIFDGDARVGVYIGLTDIEDSGKRISRYRANVMGIQRGEPYSRKNPDGYRKVHRALEAALHTGHRIVLTNRSGHHPGFEHDSYGPAPQLNEAK